MCIRPNLTWNKPPKWIQITLLDFIEVILSVQEYIRSIIFLSCQLITCKIEAALDWCSKQVFRTLANIANLAQILYYERVIMTGKSNKIKLLVRMSTVTPLTNKMELSMSLIFLILINSFRLTKIIHWDSAKT